MKLSRKAMAAIALVAVTIPAIAIAQQRGPNPPHPAQAYGVICNERFQENGGHQPGTQEFRDCVRNLARAVNGRITPHNAATRECKDAHPELGRAFAECRSQIRTLARGLRALRAR
jgi:hypothetical protein